MTKNTITRLEVDNLYHWHNNETIYDAYATPSKRKVESYNAIKARCYREGGYDLTVAGHNCHFYSTMYKTRDENGVEYLVIDTKSATKRLRIVGYYS